MKIIGLRIEKYIGKYVSGSNCDFEYKDSEFERHVLCVILENNIRVEITLTDEEGECYSGWCCASYANVEFKVVKRFNGFNFKPKQLIIIDEIKDLVDLQIFFEKDEIHCDLLELSKLGGDEYYPSGYYSVNMDLFQKTNRAKEKRPCFLFKGESAIGKSYLSSRFKKDVIVFETDFWDILPDKIVADVIVFGNRSKFSIEEIESKTKDIELVIVDFTYFKKLNEVE